MRLDVVSNIHRAAGRICSVWTCICALLPRPRLDNSADSAGHYGHGIEREGCDYEIPGQQVHRRKGGMEPMTISAFEARASARLQSNKHDTK